MRLIINGRQEEIEGTEIGLPELFRLRKVRNPEAVTVELNGRLLKRAEIPSAVVRDGDRLELLYFIGGGGALPPGARFDTKAVHAGAPDGDRFGATVAPVYQCSSFAHESPAALAEVFAGRRFGHVYSRISNPTVALLEEKVAALEDGIGAVACSSGMAAITLAVTGIASCGDEIVSGRGLFGGTHALFGRTLPRLGITARFAGSADADGFSRALTARTKLLFVEALGNPGLETADIGGIARIARRAGVPLVVDSTAVTPFLMRPKEWGADVVVHSSTKYLNGHGNAVGGVIVDLGAFDWGGGMFPDLSPYAERYGELAFLARIRREVHRDFGACLSPMNAFLTLMGIETLGLRMPRHCDNAAALARALVEGGAVSVTYPGLPSYPQHALAARQFGGRFGAMIAARLGSRDRAFRFIEGLVLARNLANIGDTRTLVLHPASTIYAEFPEEERRALGAAPDLVRICAGIEDPADLVEDFTRALGRI
ncbi:MAG: sulfur carrier protein ThiS [bacterium]|nr:sulfur carrier protein ThiS [bacterium]